MSTKLENIEKLAIKVKAGNKEATVELLQIFAPLIYKTSKRIHIRYGCIFPVDEIITQARYLLIQLTVLSYTPGGRAHYPYFLKQSLHADLTQIYRPIYAHIHKTVPIEGLALVSPSGIEEVFKDERIEVCEELIKYASQTLNAREYDIFHCHMCDDVSRNEMAKKYHVSFVRMKVIHQKIINKLKTYLSKIGINKYEDI